MMAMGYGNVYVAQVAHGRKRSADAQSVIEAEAHDGPSVIIAYSHCIAHGIDTAKGHATSRSLPWNRATGRSIALTRALAAEGKNPFQLDSNEPAIPLKDYIYTEGRYRILQQSDPGAAQEPA